MKPPSLAEHRSQLPTISNMADRPITDLTNLIAELPGLGPRQARRVVQFLLSKDDVFRKSLAEKILTIGNSMKSCEQCFRFSGLENGKCVICSDSLRDTRTLMVVEHDIDIDAIESARAYTGLYLVLGGLMSMTKQKRMSPIRTRELKSRVTSGTVREVIFALSTTPEGDYTANEQISSLKTEAPSITFTLLGRGLSAGAEIEYADSETIRNALKNRS